MSSDVHNGDLFEVYSNGPGTWTLRRVSNVPAEAGSAIITVDKDDVQYIEEYEDQ